MPAGSHQVSSDQDKVPHGGDQVSAGADQVPADQDKVPRKGDQVPAGTHQVPAGADKVSRGAHAMRPRPAGHTLPGPQHQVP